MKVTPETYIGAETDRQFGVVTRMAGGVMRCESIAQDNPCWRGLTRSLRSRRSGGAGHARVTLPIGTRDFVDALKAEPFQPFTVRADSVSLYQLGDYGTAQRKIHELHRC